VSRRLLNEKLHGSISASRRDAVRRGGRLYHEILSGVAGGIVITAVQQVIRETQIAADGAGLVAIDLALDVGLFFRRMRGRIYRIQLDQTTYSTSQTWTRKITTVTTITAVEECIPAWIFLAS
jgi:hypothetical protein